jgi:hypothetical protein
MQNANYQDEAKFTTALKTWEAPDVPASLDQRLFASYHAQMNRAPFWQRFFTTSLRVPVPLVAAAGLLLLLAGGVTIAVLTAAPTQAIPVTQTITKTEVVTVPVVEERIVTRVVYLENKTEKNAPSPVNALRPSAPPPNEIKLASHVAGDNAYTNVDLSGFQPVEEMKVRIIKGSAANEH